MSNEPTIVFNKIAPCEAATCIEVAEAGDLVHIRSSRFPSRVLTVDKDEWDAAVQTLRGEAA